MPVGQLGRAGVLGHVDVVGQRRAAERAQVDVGHDVLGDAQGRGHPGRGLELDAVPLAVAEAQRVGLEAVGAGDGEHGGGVEASAEQDHGGPG